MSALFTNVVYPSFAQPLRALDCSFQKIQLSVVQVHSNPQPYILERWQQTASSEQVVSFYKAGRQTSNRATYGRSSSLRDICNSRGLLVSYQPFFLREENAWFKSSNPIGGLSSKHHSVMHYSGCSGRRGIPVVSPQTIQYILKSRLPVIALTLPIL